MSDRFAHLDFEVPALPKPKPQPTPASMELDRLKRYQDMLAAMGIPDSYEPREVPMTIVTDSSIPPNTIYTLDTLQQMQAAQWQYTTDSTILYGPSRTGQI